MIFSGNHALVIKIIVFLLDLLMIFPLKVHTSNSPVGVKRKVGWP
jgi:hypothetical protein